MATRIEIVKFLHTNGKTVKNNFINYSFTEHKMI